MNPDNTPTSPTPPPASPLPENPPQPRPAPVAQTPKMTKEQLSAIGRGLFNKIEFDDNEQLVCEIRKHPFGLFLIYFVGFFVASAVFLASLGVRNLMVSDALQTGVDSSQYSGIVIGFALILITLIVLMTLISGFIYQSNVVLVTNEKIAQVLYKNIIARKISQLSIGDVQDVTVRQDSVFSRIFNYGTLVIETAGEQQNYNFTYTPDPYNRSKDIVGAHEVNLTLYGN